MTDETNKVGEASISTIAVNSLDDISTLESYIDSNGPMNWRECLTQFHDVCFSLETAQAGSVEIGELSIHSFIVRKLDTAGGISIEIPKNLETLGSIKNLSKSSNYSVPREAYMSPERCLDRPVNRRSDVYSLGCVIYHCLTGAPPFMHRDPEKLKEMQTIDYALPPGRRSQRRLIPDDVDMVILNCLEKDPARRYKNAGVLRANIGRVLQINEPSDEPSSRSAKFAEFRQRKRKVFVSVATLVALTAGLCCLTLSIATSDGFQKQIARTIDRKRNKFFLPVEHGPMYLAQAEFENGKMIPDKDKDPIYLKVKDQDVIIFATTKRKTVKESLEEAVHRRLILFNINLIGQDLNHANVVGGNFDHAFLAKCNLDGANFRGSQLRNSNISLSSMKGADLEGVNGPEVFFHGCNLENANLSNAVLFDCDFSKANLRNADFSYSNLLNSNFEGADLTGAKFTKATLAKHGFKTATLTGAQKSEINLIEGPARNAKEVERQARGLNLLQRKTPEDLTEKNPFSNPIEGTSFGPSRQQPIGLNIDLNHLPPEPPKKKGAPPPPPLQQAIPGQPIVVPKNQTPQPIVVPKNPTPQALP